MTAQASTTVSPAGVASLLAREQLGAGTFLEAALAVSPAPDDPILWLERPFRPFFGGSFDALSLQSLNAAATAYAAWYFGAGVRAKDPVGVYLDDGVEYLVHYIALTSLGAIPVLTNGNLAPEIAAEYFRRVGAVGLFVDEAHKGALRPHLRTTDPFRFVTVDADLRALPLPPLPPSYPFRHTTGDPIMIAHSSGTTGVPKAVVLQHGPFFHGVRYRLQFSSTGAPERILSALPHSHNCAMAYVMLALLLGNHVFVASDHGGANVARRVKSFRPSMVVAFPQSYVELTEEDLHPEDFTSVRFWFNGGDAAHEQHIRKLISLGFHVQGGSLVPGSLFIDGMGSSEMGFSLLRNAHGAGPSIYDRCVGKPLEWAEAAIFDDAGAHAGPGVIGRLAVRAPSVTSGYWNDSVLTFRSQIDGYWLTGDLAYRDGEGRIFHVDRTPDTVKTPAGTLYTLRTEELLLASFESFADCSVIAAPLPRGSEGAILLVRLRTNPFGSEDALLARANAVLQAKGWPTLAAARVVGAADIPLGTTGKVLKRLLRERHRGFFADAKNVPAVGQAKAVTW